MADLVRWKAPLLTDSGENGGSGWKTTSVRHDEQAAAYDGGKAHMAPYETDDSAKAGEVEDVRAGRRKAARYVVPFTVVGVAAATIGLVPAFAGSGDPDLPKISAQELAEKSAASDVQQVSGTVKISTDLGLPDLGGLE